MLQFDTDEIKNYITASNVPSDYKLHLRLYETEGTSGLSEEYTIAAYPVNVSMPDAQPINQYNKAVFNKVTKERIGLINNLSSI